MKKKSLLDNDEIDFISLLEIIWNGKAKIVLITIISLLIGFGYSYSLPNSYISTLVISPSENSKFTKYKSVYGIMNPTSADEAKPTNLNLKFLDTFIKELKDYEEFVFTLKDTKKIRESVSNLPMDKQEKAIFKYANLLQINKQKKTSNWILTFQWDNAQEAIDILDETVNLTFNNLEKSIYDELDQILEMKKKIELNKKLKTLEFLSEQSLIAKELNISDNQVDNINLSQSNVLLNISTTDVAYYLRGYKAIDKELELISSRNNYNYYFYEKEINSLKKTNIEWVDYNIYLTQQKSLKNTRFKLMISIFVGLLIGVFYVIISDIMQSRSISKKKIN